MAFTVKQQRFIEEYTVDWNATQAAIRAGYSEKTADKIGSENLGKPDIKAAIDQRIKALTLTADQILKMQSDLAQLDLSPYIQNAGRQSWVDLDQLIADGHGQHIKGLKQTPKGGTVVEFYDKQKAQERLLNHLSPQVGSEDNPMIINVVRVNRGSD